MNTCKKYFTAMSSITTFLFIFGITLNLFGQSTQATHNGNTDATIVHNDKTGIVLEIVEMNQNQRVMKIQDSETGRIYQSKPTKIMSNKGDAVMYREICHCTCVVTRSCR